MHWPYELQVGWRYTRAGKLGRRNGFISFISGVSMLGIALGVAALIIVLSVMNGFQKDVRSRMLAAIAHVQVQEPNGEALPDWRATMARVQQHPEVRGAAPFVATQVLIARGETMRGALLRGISPGHEPSVTEVVAQLQSSVLPQLTPGSWGIILGSELAAQLGVQPGDKLTLMAPSGQVTPAGVVPRLKQVTLIGSFTSGHFEYDSSLAMLHLDDAAKLFRLSGPNGIQLRLSDLQLAPQVGAQLQQQLGPEVQVRDWTTTNRTWYEAVQLEKRMLFIILTLIVAVAAFNLVSTLVMTVTDKQADIAILRTLGASPASIMGIFTVQGALSGILGTLAGTGFGLLVAFNIGSIVPAIERLLHTSFLPGSIYLISHMPSDPQWSDIVPITAISLVLALLATLYPSWRASRVQPAQALRYE
jgi:lipoprotein-releasing system permease protein